jgi:chitinase
MAQLKLPSRQRAVYILCLSVITAVSRTKADFVSAQYGSPVACESSGWNSAVWTYYHNLQAFQLFKQPILFDVCVSNSVNNSQSHVTFRACTPQSALFQAPIQGSSQYNSSTEIEKTSSVRRSSSGKESQGPEENSARSAIIGLLNYLKLNPTQIIMLSFWQNTVAGFYISPGLSIESVVADMHTFASSQTAKQTKKAIQGCVSAGGMNDTQSSGSFGLIINTEGDVATVQAVLAKWAAGECLQGNNSNSRNDTWWSSVSVPASAGSSNSHNITHYAGPTTNSKLSRRSTCTYIQAQAGDGCFSLAQRCGITQAQFESFNGGSSICTTVQVDQYVCCSAGSLPDFSPQPTNGNCYPYTVKANDTCGAIAKAYQMDVSGIVNNNNLTWGWMGCNDLQVGQNICLSTGNPPFPANVPTAVCGPQVNNTTPTPDPTTWASLNPCPLNACCDIWGQCGITSEFCTESVADTGAPGTAQPGSSGCISNCGTQIVASGPPDSFARIGYFEAWNNQRPCLNMWVSNSNEALSQYVS